MAGLWVRPEALADPASPDAPYAAKTASWLLYRLTGQKYRGVVTTSEWYGYSGVKCVYGCMDTLALESAISAGTDGAFFKHAHVGYSDSVPSPRQLRLRNKPVNSVLSVIQGGATLTSSDYQVTNRAYLTFTDEGRVWDFGGGVLVNYSYGVYPPEAGRRAAETLANELIKCINGDDTCRLPERVTSLSREGVSMTILDPQEFLKDGRTGIYEIDIFIKTANPAGALRKPKVFSPDIPRGESRTTS